MSGNPNKQDARQSILKVALPMVGSSANAGLDTILEAIDPEISKLFEDRNILLSDGGTITFTGTQLQFTENLNITLNQKVSGAVPQVISLGSSNQNFVSSGDMWVAVLNRTAGTATTSIITNGSALPSASSANQEVFIIAKRIDAGDGTQRIYFRNGFAMNAGQTLRLGQGGGSGSGTGTGTDLGTLQFRAQFIETFTESATNSASAVNGSAGFTNGTYSAAKQMYTLQYDASHTASGSTTTITLSGSTPSNFTLSAGDVIVNLATGEVRRITAVAFPSITIEAVFAETLTSQAVCLSQCLHTKDIYNYAGTGAAVSAAFPGTTMSEIMVDYEDNATSNSNLWTPDTGPFAAYVASVDNSNWTTLHTRIALETSQIQSVLTPTSGSNLYLRFFSDATSGTGFLNLISYEAFMQKAVNSSAGGIVWSAYGMTNNSTTPVGCTISTIGGKTTVQFTGGNQYAIGLNSGQTFGVLDVSLNGAILPRFVSGTVPTSDGYYTELSPTSIQLDRDYSSSPLDIQVVLRTQIVDASSQNTTSITGLQSELSSGFQGYVDPNANVMTATTSAGTPSAGTFYSSVINRASMIDLSQDLKLRMGVDRMMVQSVQQIATESGPNGEQVWTANNDTFGQIRFVGPGITNNVDNQGPRPVLNTTSDYCEITFYGTGLNMLGSGAGTTNLSYSVDGGGSSVFYNTTLSSFIDNRNYCLNNNYSVVRGLTLGVHTVKITAAAVPCGISGFEILNENASNMIVNPGVAYAQGQKYLALLQQTFAYNAPVTGTAGGRVAVYINSAGVVGQAFQGPTGAAFLTSASHTLEEVSRTYSPREFGAGRTDDFSRFTASQAASFTLEDGTATLCAPNCNFSTQNGVEGISFNGTGQHITLTFVGTGIDIVVNSASFVGTMTYSVDGASAVTVGTISNGIYTTKIASGLAYGTHTLRLIMTVATSGGLAINKYIVYQPKTPAIPAGAIQIGSYNVMANFVANSTQSSQNHAQGTLMKACGREALFVGTWSVVQDATAACGGWEYTSTASAANNVQFEFFGTGFDFRFYTDTAAATFQVTVDGATVFNSANNSPTGGAGWTSALTTGFYGTDISFSAATGVITMTANASSVAAGGVYLNGMTLGLHSIKIAWATGTGFLNVDAFDIITPIHSPKFSLYADLQNALPTGSQGVSDDRQTSPIRNALPATKAWAQAMGISSSPTTTSTTFVPMPDMSTTIKTNGGALSIAYSATVTGSVSGSQPNLQIYVDGLAVGPQQASEESSTSDSMCISSVLTVPVAPGFHKVDLYWEVTSGTAVAYQTNRVLNVREI